MSEPIVSVVKGSLPCVNGLGEGPHWDAGREELFYVDIMKHAVFRYIPKTEECYKVEIDSDHVSLVVPVANEKNQYVIAVDKTIQVMEWDGKSKVPEKVKLLYTGEEGMPTNKMNDGKCDAKGRLWAGSMVEVDPTKGLEHARKGALHSFDDGVAKRHVDGIDISNGLAWTADNSVMYYIDSYSGVMDAFDFDLEKGALSNRRTAFDFKTSGATGLADGMTIDANGNLWVAFFGGNGVMQIDPRVGKKIGFVKTPASRATSVAFGGPHLDTLYITTGSCFLPTDNAEDFGPADGQLYQAVNVGAKGLGSGVSYAGKI
ncbi:regucalcin [Folsomia candida]|uniref:regucalcin n=1 Tax=Folsomia candida TaxID=158441 RepID=UPI000B8F51AD|nr:regucalcin [Folsomia candida]